MIAYATGSREEFRSRALLACIGYEMDSKAFFDSSTRTMSTRIGYLHRRASTKMYITIYKTWETQQRPPKDSLRLAVRHFFWKVTGLICYFTSKLLPNPVSGSPCSE